MIFSKGQGSKKMSIHIHDLLTNNKFITDIKQYQELDTLARENKDDQLLEKADDMLLGLCAQYGLDYDEINSAIDKLNHNKAREVSIQKYSITDTCELSENKPPEYYGELDDSFYKLWKSVATIKERAHICAYPVSIQIRSIASKRDVLSFIDKNWKSIKETMDWNIKVGQINIRSREKIELADFIWENRDLPTKKIKELIEKNFSGETIGYEEVTKIKSLEKARRQKDLRIKALKA